MDEITLLRKNNSLKEVPELIKGECNLANIGAEIIKVHFIYTSVGYSSNMT